MNGALLACTWRRSSREGVARVEHPPREIPLTETLPAENVPTELFPMDCLPTEFLLTVIVKTSSPTANITVTK